MCILWSRVPILLVGTCILKCQVSSFNVKQAYETGKDVSRQTAKGNDYNQAVGINSTARYSEPTSVKID
jgi:hypothetical protein